MNNAAAEGDRDRDDESQRDALQTRLRKDVVSWSATRSDEASRRIEEFPVPIVQPAARRASARKTLPQSVTSDPKPVGQPKKPFSMSYDGVTTAEHIAYRISRGAR